MARLKIESEGKKMGTSTIKCDCCGKDKELPCTRKAYPYKLDGKFYCCWDCYSRTFNSKYKASSVSRRTRIGYKTDKTLR